MRKRQRPGVIVMALAGLTASMAFAGAEAAQPAPPPPKKQTSQKLAAQNPPIPPSPIGEPIAATRPAMSEATQRTLIERVNTYLSGMQTLVGDFVQVGPDRTRVEGHFYLQKPGRMRFEYNPPSPLELIADGQSVVVRDRKLATQDLYPLSQTPLRFLLAERIDLARDTNLISVGADDTFVSVTIEERQALGGTHRLLLMFGAKDMQLKQWTVTDPQGFDTTVALYNIDTTKKPDPSLFKINYERVIQ
jgi:outer membrane lipoprotein-sorting protein